MLLKFSQLNVQTLLKCRILYILQCNILCFCHLVFVMSVAHNSRDISHHIRYLFNLAFVLLQCHAYIFDNNKLTGSSATIFNICYRNC